MVAFDNSGFEKYKAEAQEKWGETDSYKEYTAKTKDYSEDKWNNLEGEMDSIFAGFALCIKSGENPDSDKAQKLAESLQKHITENYYLCTNEIFAGLGQMYVFDERFKNNIDKYADGTAEFVGKAIEFFVKNR
jgi:hypothetical protein